MSIVCERSFLNLASDLGIRCAFSFKMADHKYKKDIKKFGGDPDIIEKTKKTKEENDETITGTEEVKEESTVFDDGRETDIIVVEKTDGTKTCKTKADPDLYLLSDDQIAENVEDACRSIKGNGKLIDLTVTSILYMASVITPEQLYKRCKSNDDIEVVNTIIKFYSGLPITSNINCLNINEVISLNLLKEIVTFESQYYNSNLNKDEENNIVVDEIVEKTRDLIIEANRNNMKMDGVEDPDPVVPITFINKNLDLNQPQRLSKGIINKLEKEFGDILCMHNHQFNRINDLIELMIYSNGRMDQYIIDPGSIIGNGFNVICNIPGDTILVNAKHKDILAKAFADITYVLTPEEISRVNEDMFLNQSIYRMIDMSKGPEILPKLTNEEFVKFGKKLSFILNLEWNPVIIPASRLRIRSFKSIDDFVLVSDNKCKSPLYGYTLANITPGLTIRVSGDDVIVKLGDEIENKYHIDEYGIL